MGRPPHEHPTPAELQILQMLWSSGPATVRQVWLSLGKPKKRAYTTVMSLMNVMADKGLLKRKPLGKAYLYLPKAQRERTLGEMLGDLVNRGFGGSASALVMHLLGRSSPEELEQIRRTIEQYNKQS